ncbi:MAG: MotA/TolQ/ExbB proton channel family protein [Opitutaceae bacterium]|jgi:biopolymer transport protein ExbB|nr:MotA/TolQ/ExbB proton channel family protein [Opitutaceae bacterium]
MKRVLALASLVAATPLALLAQAAAAPVPAAQTKSLLEELSAPAILPLWFCSALIVYLVIDLYLKSSAKVFVSPADLETLRTYFRAGDYHGAYSWTATATGAVPAVVHAGIKHSTGGKTASEDAMGAAIIGENAKFQNKIAYLSVIGVIAPMIGLTGTVVGMIQAFAAMGQAGAADPSKLSGAIGHVLHATASGLAVAIPAFVFYYLLRNRVSHQIHELSLAVNDLFRCFPYEHMKDVSFEGGEHVAAAPNWVTGAAPVGSTQG